MLSAPVTVALRPEHFTPAPTLLASHAGMMAMTFRYRSGVAGLRIHNEAGHIEVLPFQGQQIWDAKFFGRRLTMGSMFTEPVATDDYLATYGAFFIHCGVTAMGNPGPQDSHPLHGELPNAPYDEASLIIGEDESGPYMGLTGSYHHRIAFTHNYVASPVVRLGLRDGRIRASLNIRNLKQSPMELMYLAHINFRPVDKAVLLDTVPDDPGHMRVRATLPGNFTPSEAHRKLLEDMLADPRQHREIVPGRTIDPELVLSLDCAADEKGWAHSLQMLPDGSADFVSHRPQELDHGVRWISRGGDQDALGLMLPATADPNGYIAEKAKGNLKMVPPQGDFRCQLEFGALQNEDAPALAQQIETIRRNEAS